MWFLTVGFHYRWSYWAKHPEWRWSMHDLLCGLFSPLVTAIWVYGRYTFFLLQMPRLSCPKIACGQSQGVYTAALATSKYAEQDLPISHTRFETRNARENPTMSSNVLSTYKLFALKSVLFDLWQNCYDKLEINNKMYDSKYWPKSWMVLVATSISMYIWARPGLSTTC